VCAGRSNANDANDGKSCHDDNDDDEDDDNDDDDDNEIDFHGRITTKMSISAKLLSLGSLTLPTTIK
jgi:hypothetical protein